MLGRWSIKQTFRAPVRSIAMLLVTALVCTFLTVGFDLEYSARMGREKIRETFLVAAVPSFTALVDQYGRTETQMRAEAEAIVAQEQEAGIEDSQLEWYLEPMVGKIPYSAQNYDWTEMLEAPGAERLARWRQYGVLLEGRGWAGGPYFFGNIMRLRYNGTEPLFLESCLDGRVGEYPIQPSEHFFMPGELELVQWGNVGTAYKHASIPKWTEGATLDVVELSWEGYAEGAQADRMRAWKDFSFDEEGRLTGLWLRPGQEYIISGYFDMIDGLEGSTASVSASDGRVYSFFDSRFAYDSDGFIPTSYLGRPEGYPSDLGFFGGMLPYTPDFWDTEAGQQYADFQRDLDITFGSTTAGAVDDLSLVPAFYNGKVYIAQGRAFSQEDYDTGAKVCLISGYYAEQMKLAVGDRLDMSFYASNFPMTGNTADCNDQLPDLWKPVTLSDGTKTYRLGDPFFDEGSYEIVGIYDGQVYEPNLNQVEFSLTKGMNSDTILVPSASLANRPETTRDDAWHTAILVDSKRVNEFLDDVQTSTLLDETDDGVKMDLTVYDQGLSNMTRVLEQLTRVSRLTMGLALGSAGLAVVMLSVLTLQKNKRQIASLRSLGVREKQIPQAVLAGVLVVCLVGAILGAAAGGIVSQKVGSAVLASAKEDVGDGTFSAMLAQSGGDAVDLSIVTSPLSMVLAAAGVMLVLALLCFVLVRREAKNSPILQLGAKE